MKINKKGFFTAIIAIIIVVLLSTMANVQTIIGTSKQLEISQQKMFELKTQMQSMQQMFDKAASDAMAYCYSETDCGLLAECTDTTGTKDYSKKIGEYYNAVIEAAKTNLEIDCFISDMQPTELNNDSVAFSFDLTCSKAFSNQFAVKAKKTIQIDKTITASFVVNPPPSVSFCQMQVKDNQSGICDATLNQNCSP